MENISIYIHIPFCVRKCHYCDFLSMPASSKVKKKYVQALCAEIEAWKQEMEGYQVHTIFFGGGTPSILEDGLLEQVLCKLKETFFFANYPEITVEVNPGTVDITKLRSYKESGVNRLSIGLQSTEDEELRELGRIHNFDDFMSTYNAAREVGFDNINIDLMSALPGQTVESYRKTVEKVLAFHPEHISAYSLIIEEGTFFYELYGEKDECDVDKRKYEIDYVNQNNELDICGSDEGIAASKKELPTQEEDREMYELTERLLHKHGYERYEISNYAKKGYECRHNLVYWQGGAYLGLGLGSSSYVEQIRFSGIADLNAYIRWWCEIASNRGLEKEMVANNTGLCKQNKRKNNIYNDNMVCNNYDLCKAHKPKHKEIKQQKVDNNIKLCKSRDEECRQHITQEVNNKDILCKHLEGLQYENVQVLSSNEQMEEFMFLGLRCIEGIWASDFYQRFHKTLSEIYGGVLEKMLSQKLMICERKTNREEKPDENWKLTPYGIDVSNVVLSEFLLEE